MKATPSAETATSSGPAAAAGEMQAMADSDMYIPATRTSLIRQADVSVHPDPDIVTAIPPSVLPVEGVRDCIVDGHTYS